MIKIYSENNNILERSYIIDVIFHEFLGLEYECLHSDNTDYHIVLPNGKKIIVEDKFFKIFHDDKEYLSFNNIPQNITFTFNKFTPEDDVVILYGNDKLEVSENRIVCGLDIFASSFFMLTRWEEYINKERDKHDRFPASESIAYRHNFLHRPIVNEYVDMLWNMIHYFDSTLSRKKRRFNILFDQHFP